MRRLPIIALVVCLMAGLTGSAYAAFDHSDIFTAGIHITSTGTFNPSIAMMDYDGVATISSLSGGNTGYFTWSTSAIDPLNPATLRWQVARQCLQITGTMTLPGGIEIYTDNGATDANPKVSTTSIETFGFSAGGLVCAENPAIAPLPMCWRVLSAAPTQAFDVRHGTTGYPDRLWDQASGSGYPCYLWMEDAASHADVGGVWTPNFNTNSSKDYRIIKDERGYQHSEAGWLSGGTPLYVFVAANFKSAVGGRTYATNKIIVHAYSE